MQYLGINLTQDVQDMYNYKNKSFLREILKNVNERTVCRVLQLNGVFCCLLILPSRFIHCNLYQNPIFIKINKLIVEMQRT